MKGILVDSNVLLDLILEDPVWMPWSMQVIETYGARHRFYINPIIYSEVSIGFETIESCDAALSEAFFTRLPIPAEAAFLAGKVFLSYRRRGGEKPSTLPDFFIGAHAAVSNLMLMTRDKRLYKTYFPTLEIIAP